MSLLNRSAIIKIIDSVEATLSTLDEGERFAIRMILNDEARQELVEDLKGLKDRYSNLSFRQAETLFEISAIGDRLREQLIAYYENCYRDVNIDISVAMQSRSLLKYTVTITKGEKTHCFSHIGRSGEDLTTFMDDLSEEIFSYLNPIKHPMFLEE